MKYIALFTLLILQVSLHAATTFTETGGMNTDTNVMNSFGNGVDVNKTLTGSSNTGNDQGTAGSVLLNDSGTAGSALLNDQGSAGTGIIPVRQAARSAAFPDIGKPNLTIGGFVGWIIKLMNYLVWAMMTAALLVFLYGIFILMFVGGANEESRSKGKKFMFWGIISLFVMVSVWGLVGILNASIFGGNTLIGPQFK